MNTSPNKTTHMRVYTFKEGHATLVSVGGLGHLNPEDVEAKLTPFVHADNTISNLFIDFSGDNIPVLHREELRMLSRMLAQYYNTSTNVEHEVSAI